MGHATLDKALEWALKHYGKPCWILKMHKGAVYHIIAGGNAELQHWLQHGTLAATVSYHPRVELAEGATLAVRQAATEVTFV